MRRKYLKIPFNNQQQKLTLSSVPSHVIGWAFFVVDSSALQISALMS